MKLVNVRSGKVGTCIIGPKYYLHEPLKLGEAALCIARDMNHSKPSVWLIGGIEQLIDYVSLARTKDEITEDIANMLLARLDEAKKSIPTSAIERLASVTNMSIEDLKEFVSIAQVCISPPIDGVRDFSSTPAKWVPKTAKYDSIH